MSKQLKSFSWRKWRVGLCIAIFCGLLNAGAGAMIGMSWQAFVSVLCASLLTNLLTYLKDHPIEAIDDTDTFRRDAPASPPMSREPNNTPAVPFFGVAPINPNDPKP